MRIDVITIFPEYLAPLDVSLVGKARAKGLIDVRVHDLRTWTHDKHRTVDDTPFGGGPGMVMKPEPWGEALDAVVASSPKPPSAGTTPAGAESTRTTPAVRESTDTGSSSALEGATVGDTHDGAAGALVPTLIVPTPSGRPFTQELAAELARLPWLAFTPARYEGIDRRVIEDAAMRMPVEEVSIGDYVLAGGEAAVLVIIEAVARLLPGVLGNAASHQDDSFAPGAMADLLEGPVYTKPPVWRGREVPEVLLSGHHGRIARWRRDEAFRRTAERRPDLIERCDPSVLDKHDVALLERLGWTRRADGRFWRASGAVEE